MLSKTKTKRLLVFIVLKWVGKVRISCALLVMRFTKSIKSQSTFSRNQSYSSQIRIWPYIVISAKYGEFRHSKWSQSHLHYICEIITIIGIVLCKYIQNMPSIFLRNHDGAHITYKLLRTYSFTTSYVQIACVRTRTCNYCIWDKFRHT